MVILSTALGYVMRLCYQLVNNYAWAIILFTLFTKVILLPLSIWVQKNSVKMVRMQPEINRIKTKYFGFSDQVAEEQSALYKREKYNPLAGLVPMFVQIVLLMGLIDVIYQPLTHLLHLAPDMIQNLVQIAQQVAGADPASSSVQLAVVQAIQSGTFAGAFSAGVPAEIISVIQNLNLNLFGINLALVPSVALGITLLMPVAAGLAAWLLCVAQNVLNPLQAEQGNLNKYGMMIFSVGISLCLGAFVPLGVGFYWIWSNLFSILQQVVLNWMIDPKKFIDYPDLEASKKELAELENIGGKKKGKDPFAKREKADYKRFFGIVNKHLVFYSESSGFYKYFQNIIEYILSHSNVTIHYITGDPNDAIFEKAKTEPKIKPYYIGAKKLITMMMKMDADMVVMTMPDLETYHIKRSYVRADIEYVYTDHGISSDNLTLRTHALDHYDTLFCVGPHQVEEARAIEKLYSLKPRTLVEAGYGLLDNMTEAYAKMEKIENPKKTILIAPSWQKDNLLDSCLDDLLTGIVGKGFRVILRPHPQYVRIYAERMERIIERYKNQFCDDFSIETDFSSNVTVYTADLVITDWSNIGYEFSFATCKPTLYINTPIKVMNPEYEKIDIVPFDIRVRSQIGAALEPDALQNVGAVAADLIARTPEYHDIIQKIREETMFNLGSSGEAGGKYILNRMVELNQKKKQS
ncbi:MAG: membrane protein insertase YidC [Ruthenibacterium sp.]